MSFSPIQPDSAGRGFTDDFDFQEMVAAIRARGWLITIIVLTSLIAAGIYCFLAPKIYRATVRIMVEPKAGRVVKIEDVQQQDLQSETMLNTVAQSLSSRPLMRRVAVANDLKNQPEFLPGVKQSPNFDGLANILTGMVEIKLIKDTRLIDISMEHQSPLLAKQLASSVINEYILQGMEARSKTTDVARQFLIKQVEETKTRLETAEQALQKYTEVTKSVSLDDRSNIVLEKLKELNSKLSDVRSQRARLEADAANLRQVGNNPERMLAVPSVAGSPNVAELRRSVAAQEVDLSTLGERYRARHPEMLAARSKLEQLQTKLREAILRAPDQIAAGLAVAQETERTFQSELDQLEKNALDVKSKSIQYNALNRDVETSRALYTSLLQRLKETEVSSDLTTTEFRVVDPPETPTSPVKPAKLKIMLLTLVGSFALGSALAVGLNAIDSSIKTTDQAERALGLAVVAAIPFGRKIKKGERPLITNIHPQDPISEAFRTLRTALVLSAQQGEARACGFTSSIAGEGKSFCSANYAVTLAQQGLRTLIIDADLRRPMVSQFFAIGPNQPGVTEVLTSQKTFEEAIFTTDIDKLFVLPVGSIPYNPAELLGGPGFAEIMKKALAQYDRVVVDTAPVNLVSDTLLIAKTFHRLCLVVQASQTPAGVVRHAISALAGIETKVTGIVLNQIKRTRVGGYYYSYSSDKVYGSDSVYGASRRPPQPAGK